MIRKFLFYSLFILSVGCSQMPRRESVPLQTPIITITPTLMPSSTHTPLPTIHPDDLQRVILDLVKTNKGCEYPCWWGIKPGETDWQTAQAFLKTLSPEFWIPDNKEFITVTVPLPDNWSYDSSGSIDFFIQGGVIKSISGFTDHSIADFLSKYGQPNEIWIVYREYELQPPYYFYAIALNYSEKGFMALSGKEVFQNDHHRLCPFRAQETEKLIDGYNKAHTIDHPTMRISLWNPKQDIGFLELASLHYTSLTTNEVFQPLVEVTNLNIEQFTEIYKVSDTNLCIDIKMP